MKKSALHLVILAVMMIAGLAVWTGCDESTTDDYAILNITPASIGLRPGQTATFTASLPPDLTNSATYYPLKWNVTTPGLGKFIQISGNTAIYQAIASGVSTITVKDQIGREGSAVITQ